MSCQLAAGAEVAAAEMADIHRTCRAVVRKVQSFEAAGSPTERMRCWELCKVQAQSDSKAEHKDFEKRRLHLVERMDWALHFAPG